MDLLSAAAAPSGGDANDSPRSCLVLIHLQKLHKVQLAER